MMKFSILIANYNNGKFFKDCYNSLLNQQYENWEAIIVDDASTDDSVSVIKDFIRDDPRFRLYHNSVNSGVGVTKGKLIDLAEGDICGFVDPDDAVLPTAVLTAVNKYLISPDTVMTYSRCYMCDENLNPAKLNKSAAQVPNGDPYFFNCPVQINHFVTFRKAVYNQIERMNSNLKIAEDQDLYLKLYEKGPVHFIDDTNYLYRAHEGGISQNNNKSKSYAYWAEALWLAMKRRGLTTINGKPVPEVLTNPQEIFDLLEYQNKLPFRIRKKFRVWLQKLLP